MEIMTTKATIDRRLCVAPMMDWTDRHCRFFHRQLAPGALLYTEMVTTGAILHGDRERLLGFSPEEHPLALQLGGSDPGDLAQCARVAEECGYDEVNLNVGCPSDRVQKGRFGACLMLEPELVTRCVGAMQDAVNIPVTVKTRLGVDDHDSYEWFSGFVEQVAQSCCKTFIIHARKAWLSGLSPKQNREVPELRHEWVNRFKHGHSDLEIIINGGISSAGDMMQHLENLDGVMLGRAAYQTPWVLKECQRVLDGRAENGDSAVSAEDDLAERLAIIDVMTSYLSRQAELGVPAKHISRHVLGLFQSLPGARKWRRYISEHAHLDDSNAHLLLDARKAMVNPPSREAQVA